MCFTEYQFLVFLCHFLQMGFYINVRLPTTTPTPPRELVSWFVISILPTLYYLIITGIELCHVIPKGNMKRCTRCQSSDCFEIYFWMMLSKTFLCFVLFFYLFFMFFLPSDFINLLLWNWCSKGQEDSRLTFLSLSSDTTISGIKCNIILHLTPPCLMNVNISHLHFF